MCTTEIATTKNKPMILKANDTIRAYWNTICTHFIRIKSTSESKSQSESQIENLSIVHMKLRILFIQQK